MAELTESATGRRGTRLARTSAILLMAGVAAAPVLAAPEPVDEVKDEPALERAREMVRETSIWMAAGVNDWFGDLPIDRGNAVADGRLNLRWLHRERSGGNLSVRFNARFNLPNVERIGYFFVGSDNEREVLTDTPSELRRFEQLRADVSQERSAFAGIGVLLRSFDLRLGVRGPLKPYAQARYRRPMPLGERNRAEFRQTFFLTVGDRLGSTTALSLEHDQSSTVKWHWLSALTITQAKRRHEWSSSIGLVESLPEHRQRALLAIISGRQGAGVPLTEYGLQARWQQPAWRDWLIGELSLGHYWPRPDRSSSRTSEWAAGAGLTMLF